MKHLKTTLAFLLFFGITPFIFGVYAQNEAVEKMHDLYTSTINNANLDNLDALYTKDVTIRNSDGSMTSGLVNVKALYKATFASGTYNIILKTNDVTALDKNYMFVSGTFVYSKIDEPKGVLKGEFVNTLKNVNSNWLIYKSNRYLEITNNASVVDELYKAFAKGDVPTVLGLMDEKITWNEAESNNLADGNPYIGPEAVLNGVFGRVIGGHEYFKLADIELHEMSNNQVLSTLRYDGKFKESGKIYNAQAAHLWTFNADGKIIAFQQYVDTKKLAEAEEK